MGKAVQFQVTQIGIGTATNPSSVPKLTLDGKIINITIRNDSGSAQSLWVGLNEPAGGKIALAAGESLSLAVGKDNAYYTGYIAFAWPAQNAANKAFCIVEKETDEDVC